MPLSEALDRAAVFEPDLKRQLYPLMKSMKPLPAAFDPNFVAANQSERADNLIPGTKKEQLEKIRADIRNFKAENELDDVIILWTANTEKYSEILPGINDTAENLLKSVAKNHREVAPSALYGMAAIFEKCGAFLNGSPQNTFVPGILELAKREKIFIGGDDFKTGQTKVKSVLVDFLISSGIKPKSIVSYNHLGNNDGKNLSAPAQFRSKEISKSNVVDDMVASNAILYPDPILEAPDHVVVIKYVPHVGDSKRAMDEYRAVLKEFKAIFQIFWDYSGIYIYT